MQGSAFDAPSVWFKEKLNHTSSITQKRGETLNVKTTAKQPECLENMTCMVKFCEIHLGWCGVAEQFHQEFVELSVLTANLGSYDWRCILGCWGRLCLPETEQAIQRQIQRLRPDLIFFQETLPLDRAQRVRFPWLCRHQMAAPEAQVRRLLGEDYTIVCDAIHQCSCIALRKEVGVLEGCSPGALCKNARTGRPLKGCDPGFKVSVVTVALPQGVRFDAVNVHLSSISPSCRERKLALLFEGEAGHPPLLQEEKVLIAGDFNFDPWRGGDRSVRAWQRYFKQGWRGRPFRYHMALDAQGRPPFTLFAPLVRRRTIDFVVSNFAEGECQVLGATPGTERLDGGRGMDHRAVYGVLRLPLAEQE